MWTFKQNCNVNIYLAVPNGTDPHSLVPDYAAIARQLLLPQPGFQGLSFASLVEAWHPRLVVPGIDQTIPGLSSISTEIVLPSADMDTASWVEFVDSVQGNTDIWWQILDVNVDPFMKPTIGLPIPGIWSYFFRLQPVANFGF